MASTSARTYKPIRTFFNSHLITHITYYTGCSLSLDTPPPQLENYWCEIKVTSSKVVGLRTRILPVISNSTLTLTDKVICTSHLDFGSVVSVIRGGGIRYLMNTLCANIRQFPLWNSDFSTILLSESTYMSQNLFVHIIYHISCVYE